VEAMEDSAMGSSVLASWLRDVRAQVEKDGEITDDALQKLGYQNRRTTS